MDDSSQRRWEQMLDGLAGLLPDGSRRVLVDGPADRVSLFAARLTERLASLGHPVLVTADVDAAVDVSIFLRTAPGGRHAARRLPQDAGRARRRRAEENGTSMAGASVRRAPISSSTCTTSAGR